MRKILIIGLILTLHISINAQVFVDGPANLRKNPNGEILLSIENNVNVELWENNENWYKVVLVGYIKGSTLKDNFLPKNSDIYDKNLKIIGKTITGLDLSGHLGKSDIENYLSTSIVGYTYKTNIKELSINEILQEKEIVFNDSSNNKLLIYEDNGTTYYHSTETNYLLTSIWLNNEFDRLLIKSLKTTKYALGSEGCDTKIDLIFYPKLLKSKHFSYSKKADRFELQNNYLISEKYGCCGAENSFELSTFPENNQFLEYNTHFYHIEIPNSKNEIFFGVNIEPRFQDTTGLIVCGLNYAFNSKQSGKIIFKTKTKNQRENIVPFTPEIELISQSSKDKIHKNIDYDEMTAWSLNKCNDFYKISNIGIRITFMNDSNGDEKEYNIFVENGEIKEKEIIIDLQ